MPKSRKLKKRNAWIRLASHSFRKRIRIFAILWLRASYLLFIYPSQKLLERFPYLLQRKTNSLPFSRSPLVSCRFSPFTCSAHIYLFSDKSQFSPLPSPHVIISARNLAIRDQISLVNKRGDCGRKKIKIQSSPCFPYLVTKYSYFPVKKMRRGRKIFEKNKEKYAYIFRKLVFRKT